MNKDFNSISFSFAQYIPQYGLWLQILKDKLYNIKSPLKGLFLSYLCMAKQNLNIILFIKKVNK